MASLSAAPPRRRTPGALPVVLAPSALLRLLRSRSVALGLMALIVAAALAGTLLPQRIATPAREYAEWTAAHPAASALAEALRLTDVYRSWWFLALLAALFLSLLLCTVERVRQVWKLDQVRHRQGRATPVWVRMAPHHVALPLNGPAAAHLEQAAAALAAAGYGVRWENDDRLFAEKGRLGVWGSTLLHVSILMILAGGVYSGAAKMVGYVELVEGQTFIDQAESYLQIDRGLLFDDNYRGFQMRLRRFQVEHAGKDLTGITSAVTLIGREGERQQANISVSNPIVYQGLTIYQSTRYGFAVQFTLRDMQGNTVHSGLVNFAIPQDRTQAAVNRFPIPRTLLRAEADFHPSPGGGPTPEEVWRREQPVRPWLYLFLRDDEGRVVFQGKLAPGDEAPAGTYALRFDGVQRWTGFPLVRDPGIPLIYAGFALCVLGPVLLYLWTPKRIWVWVQSAGADGSLLCIGGRADRYQPAFAEELGELAAQLGNGRVAERDADGPA